MGAAREEDGQKPAFAIGDQEVEEAIAEANGDAREAIRMLLHDLVVMAGDADRLVSHGYVRGRQPWRRTG
ncbi:hypothetical protein AB6806_10985 [Bosea sp. RCC_152_1]|uniref:hypothetical protein n=1 Tax=Bosea sp. RCC_152_1 TaxID=3239228 RepID=UPI003525F166